MPNTFVFRWTCKCRLEVQCTIHFNHHARQDGNEGNEAGSLSASSGGEADDGDEGSSEAGANTQILMVIEGTIHVSINTCFAF